MAYLKKKYRCVKCGVRTINNQTVGSHCSYCWDNFVVTTTIEMPIDQNLRKWLAEK